ncbi:hypothetical protein CK203_114582 [Vitis vinifera]|uniref:Uncharacterized protein n=1 Tax=Vitis vinifera TaxID=29760 RepID=A0A438CDC3_VITVI|nr:hypothetical protein CK203_114582 [Vitis vinifera]
MSLHSVRNNSMLGLLSSSSFFKQFLHFTKIPPSFLHLNAVRVLMVCSILNMLFHLELSLLEVLFIYTIKMRRKGIFSLSAHIRPFYWEEEERWLVEWVEKASFDQLNKLFVISTSERHYQTLLTDQNLLSVVQKPQPYIIPIFPRLAPKVLVPNEHHVLKDLPLYEEARAINAKARQDQLNQREKKHQEGTLRQL